MALPDSESLDDFLGEEVVDSDGTPIGNFSCYWEHDDGKPVFLGIETGSREGATHLLPAKDARLDTRKSYVVVNYSAEKVQNAPCLDCGCELDLDLEREAFNYYGAAAFDRESSGDTESIRRELRRKFRAELPEKPNS